MAAVLVLSGGGSSDGGDPSGTTQAQAKPNAIPFRFKTVAATASPAAALIDGTIDVAAIAATSPLPATALVLSDDRSAAPLGTIIPIARQDFVLPELASIVAMVSKGLTADALPGLVALASAGAKPEDVARGFLEGRQLLAPATVDAAGPVRIGTTGGLDLQLVSQAYGQVLAAATFEVTFVADFADDTAAMTALTAGDVDLVVGPAAGLVRGAGADPTGLTHDLTALPGVIDSLLARANATVLAPTAIDRSFRFVTLPQTATRLGLASLSDLSGARQSITIGGVAACIADESCLPLLKGPYRMRFTS